MIAIVDYRAGNLTSVRLALEYLGVSARITQDAHEIEEADRVIFPGVGAARAAMTHLSELGILDSIKRVVSRGRPFWGFAWEPRSFSTILKKMAGPRVWVWFLVR